MNGASDELSAIYDACTWPVSAMNKTEPVWATRKLIQSSSPASSLHDVMHVKTSHLNPQPGVINRNASDKLALETLAQELSVSNINSTPLLPPLSTLSLNEIVEISHQRFDQNPLDSGLATSESEKLVEELSTTAASVVPQMSLSSIVDKENRIEIENPQTLAPYIYSVLKAELNMACAAAAIRFGEPSTHPKNQVQVGQNLEPSPEYKIDAMQRKRKVEIRQTISDASSKEDSETIEQIDTVEAKRARRLVVNRNSARSYRRRQIQITELQAEIDKLMDEHASMASEFAREQKKHVDAIVENEKLKDEIGALTARLIKVEERVEELIVVNIYFLDDNESNNSVARKPQFDDYRTSTSNRGSQNLYDSDVAFMQGR
ncbi:hypothetical protein SADUNF_Sadunf01G0132000 [Salix dunnii]|uniref:BZIP domain-containing protein n=1 Tax=Salix dunnii TaxID=1413687 RepID=A0A835NB40_9ROSI|nr:hypothetical protein SADUNF_Sadunf01G0132000 [Salix dunnii]